MFSYYCQKYITILLVVAILSGGFFLADKSRRAISIDQVDLSDAKAEIPDQLSLNTPFNPTLNIAQTHFSDRTCNIVDYGAKGDGQTKNTTAFASAILDCAEKGGGQVIVPPGVWLTGPINLLNNINLVVQKNAEILFSTDFSDYFPPVFSRFEGVEYYNFSPMIYANNAKNIAITGEGILNGQGEAWWDFSWSDGIKRLYSMGEHNLPVDERVFATEEQGLRPAFIEFIDCNRVLMDSVTVLKGPMWTIHPIYSQNIIIQNVNIDTTPGPSTDGIVIDSSKNVLVDGATLSTGDDAITIKSGRDNDGRRINISSENIVLQNITVKDAHGAFAIGSEISGNVRNVLAQNFSIDEAQYAFRVKSNQQRGGIAENIWIKNFKIDSLSQAVIQLNAFYERRTTNYTDFPPTFRNINIENLSCHATKDSINVFGLSDNLDAINNLNLKNISIEYSRNGAHIENTTNIKLENVTIAPKYGAVFNVKNSQNVEVSASPCQNRGESCFAFEGSILQNIQLDENNFSTKNKRIFFEQDVARDQINFR